MDIERSQQESYRSLKTELHSVYRKDTVDLIRSYVYGKSAVKLTKKLCAGGE